MSFRVEFSRQAAKDLKRLDRVTIKRLEARIDELAQAPFNPRISQQKETDPESRKSRVGDWRRQPLYSPGSAVPGLPGLTESAGQAVGPGD